MTEMTRAVNLTGNEGAQMRDLIASPRLRPKNGHDTIRDSQG